MADKELSIRFKVNDDGSIVLDKISQNLKKIETNSQSVKNSLSLIKFDSLVNLGEKALHTGERIYQVAKSAVSALNDIDRLSKVAGMSADQFQKMQYAAKMTDVEAGDLAIAIKKLSQAMDDATRETGEAAGWFKTMGISVTDTDGRLKSLDKVMGEIANKFASWEDGPRKIAIAVDLFGRSGQNLIPYLNQGAAGLKKFYEEAERLGVILDEQIIKKGTELEDTFKRVEAVTDAFWKKMVVGAVSVIEKIEELRKSYVGFFYTLQEKGIGGAYRYLFPEKEIGPPETRFKLPTSGKIEAPEKATGLEKYFASQKSYYEMLARQAALIEAFEYAIVPEEKITKGIPDVVDAIKGAITEVEREYSALGEMAIEANQKMIDAWNVPTPDEILENINRVIEAEEKLGEAAINRMELQESTWAMGKKALEEQNSWMNTLSKNIADQWASSMSMIIRSTDSAGDKIKNIFKGIADSVVSSITRMISNWLIFGSITGEKKQSGGSWLTGSLWSGLLGWLFHEGGIVGEGGMARMVNMSAFANAPRYHSGFAPGEYPAILQRGEGVFTPDQMRALSPAKKADSSGNTFVYISAIDAKSFDDMVSRNPDSIIKVIEKDARGAGSMRKIIRST